MWKQSNLLGIKFYPVGLNDAVEIVIQHVNKKAGDYFCLANIHLVMESIKNSELKKILNESAGNFPDGMGVAWALKILGNKFKGRVRGTDLMLELCHFASRNNLKVFLYGSTKENLIVLKNRLEKIYKGIKIVGIISPPFRPLTDKEDELFTHQINDSGADILFVSLGAPKQEKWMAEHKGRIKAVQLGVGAAFDFITGKVKQAPVWMQNIGLEWLYRLPQQPVKTTSRMLLAPEFVFRVLKEFVNQKMKGTNVEEKEKR